MAELFPRCTPGQIACVEPGWERPEFADYLVQRRIFAYSLSSREANGACAVGPGLDQRHGWTPPANAGRPGHDRVDLDDIRAWCGGTGPRSIAR